MILVEGKKEIHKDSDDFPTCPRCKGRLDYMDTTWFCLLDGTYFDVLFKEKGFIYREIGVFG